MWNISIWRCTQHCRCSINCTWMANFLFLCTIQHGTYRNLSLSAWNSIIILKYWNNILKYFHSALFVVVVVLTSIVSPFCCTIVYSAMVHPQLMRQFPSRHAITPSISSHYVQGCPKTPIWITSSTKIPQNFLIGHEFQMSSGKLGLGR